MKKYAYSWSRHYAVDAQTAGDIIQRLAVKSAEALLATAAEPESPLHSVFEWDDSKAAQQYRLVQARTLINSLRVEIVGSDNKPEHVMAFIGSSSRVGYIPVMEATSEELDDAEQECLRQMNGFKNRWKGMKFARAVIEVIDQTSRSASRKRKAG